MTTVPFAVLLREYRDQAGLSQGRLAERAGFDHSYVSRLESGERLPRRTAVHMLADALHLAEPDRDALLMAAGYMPGRIESLLDGEPVLAEALALLTDTRVAPAIRDDVRHMLGLLLRQARRAALESATAAMVAGGGQ